MFSNLLPNYSNSTFQPMISYINYTTLVQIYDFSKTAFLPLVLYIVHCMCFISMNSRQFSKYERSLMVCKFAQHCYLFSLSSSISLSACSLPTSQPKRSPFLNLKIDHKTHPKGIPYTKTTIIMEIRSIITFITSHRFFA